jgi:hypothetical protein
MQENAPGVNSAGRLFPNHSKAIGPKGRDLVRDENGDDLLGRSGSACFESKQKHRGREPESLGARARRESRGRNKRAS